MFDPLDALMSLSIKAMPAGLRAMSKHTNMTPAPTIYEAARVAHSLSVMEADNTWGVTLRASMVKTPRDFFASLLTRAAEGQLLDAPPGEPVISVVTSADQARYDFAVTLRDHGDPIAQVVSVVFFPCGAVLIDGADGRRSILPPRNH
jgi:hypothetical protein